MTTPPHILVCDHRGEGLAEHLRGLAAGGFRMEVAGDLRATREALAQTLAAAGRGGAPEAIVLEPLAVGGTAEIAEIDRLRGESRPLPILLVIDEQDPLSSIAAARSLPRGAYDLVHRGAPVEEYRLRLERLLLETARSGEIDELRHRALFDDRTELLRPQAFQQRLSEHFSAAERHRFELAFALIDLDDFGRVNKAYDHTVGDLVIGRVGAAIRSALRAEDVAGRLGGDEFAVALPYTGRIDAARVVRRLKEQIATLSGEVAGAPPGVRTTASIGFETFDGSDLASIEALRAHAEAALREAKRRGGDRAVYYRSLSARGRG